jgi:EmrB/QacA subfamily drug resistance transporter
VEGPPSKTQHLSVSTWTDQQNGEPVSTRTGPDEAFGPPLEAENHHGHRHLGLALIVIATAQLMVLLDATIVNIALPSIQRALHFSSTNLAWVINGYTLAFGGLLLLGGRAGDLFGRRRVFVFGILLFATASLLGGLATSEAWLVGARVLQGAGAAVASPTALSLVTTTFPEGPPRNRAMAVYAAMSGAGAAVGLIAGGLLTDYLSWRWTLFVNVPIGVLIAVAAPRVLGESKRETGRIDLPGALTGTVGLTALVYGITRASDHGWSDTWTMASFVASTIILGTFLMIETRHPHPILPLRLFRDRNRSGAYGVMLVVGAAMFGMFYFLSLFVQLILGYSPIKAGVAFLPFTVGIVVGAGVASQLAPRLPPRVIAGVGLALATVGLLMFAQLEPGSDYSSALLLPMIIMAVGMGLAFVPFTLAAVSAVEHSDAGIASAVLNTMQQVGGSLGLAILATVSASVADNRLHDADTLFFQAAARHDVPLLQRAADALTHGYTTAFLVGTFMLLAALVITLVTVNAPKQQPQQPQEKQPAPVG